MFSALSENSANMKTTLTLTSMKQTNLVHDIPNTRDAKELANAVMFPQT